MNCLNCSSKYDLNKKVPKLLPHCGHSICQECLLSLKNDKNHFCCPFDNLEYSSNQILNDNLFIMD